MSHSLNSALLRRSRVCSPRDTALDANDVWALDAIRILTNCGQRRSYSRTHKIGAPPPARDGVNAQKGIYDAHGCTPIERLELIRRALRRFERVDCDFATSMTLRINRDEFPIPEFGLLLLRDIMGFSWTGKDEKVAWTVYAAFDGMPMAFALRKFGFRIDCSSEHTGRKALGALRKASKLAEPILFELASEQAHAGNVVLVNKFNDFHARYWFFRNLAVDAYNSPPPSPNVISTNSDGMATGYVSDPFKPQREGYWFASAMVDAFFSRLEHQCTLLLPFIGFDPTGSRLSAIIRDDWGPKFKAVFNINVNLDAKRIYDRLFSLRERIRNPLAHGGFEKGDHSLYFHVPTIGTLPGSLSRISDSAIQFKFIAIERHDFEEICAIFDDFEAFVGSSLRRPQRYVESGLNVAFDERSRREYAASIANDDVFENYLEYQTHLADMHANMDW